MKFNTNNPLLLAFWETFAITVDKYDIFVSFFLIDDAFWRYDRVICLEKIKHYFFLKIRSTATNLLTHALKGGFIHGKISIYLYTRLLQK